MAENGPQVRSLIGILGQCIGYSMRVTSEQFLSAALQGAFVEHKRALEKLTFNRRIEAILVRTPEDLNRCDALIIPGGGM